MEGTKRIDMNWKPEIYKMSHGGGSIKRLLRPFEAYALINEIDMDNQPLFKTVYMSNVSARRWLRFIWFTGMRLSEAIKLKQNPEYDNKPLFNPDRKTIFLPKKIFGNTGKLMVVNKQRTVYLSDYGVPVVEAFLNKADMPRTKEGIIITKDVTRKLAVALDYALIQSAKKLGFPATTFEMTRKVYDKTKFDKYNGEIKRDKDGNVLYKKCQVPMKEKTTGVQVRSFRSSWESYLVKRYMTDPIKLLTITGSMGHTEATAREYYILADEFDKGDMEGINMITEGWANLEPAPELKEYGKDGKILTQEQAVNKKLNELKEEYMIHINKEVKE